MKNIKDTELFKAMKSCGRYSSDEEIVEMIQGMRDEVAAGADPEEELHMEGFEPDYVFDLL